MPNSNSFLSGFACIIGPPNAGKSTLLNTLINFPLNIISSRPQTTRNSILGILNNADENIQIIFIDTPGILKKEKSLLDGHMKTTINRSLEDADFIIFMLDVTTDTLEPYLPLLTEINAKKPVLVLFNKIDLDEKKAKTPVECPFPYLFISAQNKDVTTQILPIIKPWLTDNVEYYPTDVMSNRTERFFVKEYIREAMLNHLMDEIPHAAFVDVEEMTEEKEKWLIKATIFCEKDSQKKIIIGSKGDMIKQLGIDARKKAEVLLGKNVRLELFVKVAKDWKNDKNFLRKLEYY